MLLLAPLFFRSAAAFDSAHFSVTNDLSEPIPQRFVGFSIEVSSVPGVFLKGGLGGSPRFSFAALMNTLKDESGSSLGPNFRLGGNSADESAWVPDPAPMPANSTYRITQADLDAYKSVLPSFNGTITLDTSLRYGTDPSYTLAHIAASKATLGVFPLGFLENIEIGNEPDLFFKNGIRSASYNYSEYLSEYRRYVSAINSSGVLGSEPLGLIQAGTFASGRWDPEFASYCSAFPGHFGSVSVHSYAESTCPGTSTPTLAKLLDNNVTERLAAALVPLQKAATAANTHLLIGEGNSVSCGGKEGVSDVFGAALWSVDSLFTVASVGLTRWNFHGMPGGPYATLAFPEANAETVQVKPLYYGLLSFSAATAGPKSRLRGINTVSSSNSYLHCWAVQGIDPTTDAGELRFVVLHKDPGVAVGGGANITVSVPPAFSQGAVGTLTRLLSGDKGMLTKWDGGISWGGLSWSNSSDGVPSGSRKNETVSESGAGVYSFFLPAASLAILTLPMA